MKITKCPKCGSKKFKEVIEKGIKQEIIYEEGYLVEEKNTYDRNEGRAFCFNCNYEFEEYDF